MYSLILFLGSYRMYQWLRGFAETLSLLSITCQVWLSGERA